MKKHQKAWNGGSKEAALELARQRIENSIARGAIRCIACQGSQIIGDDLCPTCGGAGCRWPGEPAGKVHLSYPTPPTLMLGFGGMSIWAGLAHVRQGQGATWLDYCAAGLALGFDLSLEADPGPLPQDQFQTWLEGRSVAGIIYGADDDRGQPQHWILARHIGSDHDAMQRAYQALARSILLPEQWQMTDYLDGLAKAMWMNDIPAGAAPDETVKWDMGEGVTMERDLALDWELNAPSYRGLAARAIAHIFGLKLRAGSAEGSKPQ